MRIYRANGFVVIEDVSSYLPNQLVAFKTGNNIHIRQVGVSKKEVIVPYHAVKDVNGEQVAEDVDAALLYVESIIYASQSSKKTATITFNPPASAYFNVRILDVDARSGESYFFTPKYNDGEAEWNAFVATAFCFVDGEIELFIHAPTGLFVGEYEFEYRVI